MISNKELLSLYKLKHLIRYNTRPKIENESVAEHMYFVSIIALKICRKLKVSDDILKDVLIKSILHDIPEMDLNDITHDVKVKLDLYPFLKKYEDEYFVKNYPDDAELMIDNSDNLVNQIVDYADITSVLQFCLREMSLGNNSDEICEIYNSTVKRLTESKLHSLIKARDNNETLDDTN